MSDRLLPAAVAAATSALGYLAAANKIRDDAIARLADAQARWDEALHHWNGR